MKKLIFSIALFFSALFSANLVSAQYVGPTSIPLNLMVDKMVGKPYATKGGATDVEYVDNLSASDTRFKPGDEVWFKIKVKNTSNTDISTVVLYDYLPEYLEPIEGPGVYDKATKTITYQAGDFSTDEEKIFYLKMKIKSQDYLPSDKGLFCFSNTAKAIKGTSAADEDSAQLCVEKTVTPGKITPSAGPEYGLALLAGESALLLVGLQLKKFLNRE